MRLPFFFGQWICLLSLLLSSGKVGAFEMAPNFYSETAYDSRYEGWTTDSRARLYALFLQKRVNPFVGLGFSRDLSSGSAPQYIQNAFAPSVGLETRILSFPYLAAMVERKWIYKTESSGGSSYLNELKTGLYFYHLQKVSEQLFAETYSEWVKISYLENNTASGWIKLGHDVAVSESFSYAPYTELFTRQSGSPDYGPLENEWRLGIRAKVQVSWLSIGLLTHYALASNVKAGGVDALLVLSAGGF